MEKISVWVLGLAFSISVNAWSDGTTIQLPKRYQSSDGTVTFIDPYLLVNRAEFFYEFKFFSEKSDPDTVCKLVNPTYVATAHEFAAQTPSDQKETVDLTKADVDKDVDDLANGHAKYLAKVTCREVGQREPAQSRWARFLSLF